MYGAEIYATVKPQPLFGINRQNIGIKKKEQNSPIHILSFAPYFVTFANELY